MIHAVYYTVFVTLCNLNHQNSRKEGKQKKNVLTAVECSVSKCNFIIYILRHTK